VEKRKWRRAGEREREYLDEEKDSVSGAIEWNGA